jgi:hypothetical protein
LRIVVIFIHRLVCIVHVAGIVRTSSCAYDAIDVIVASLTDGKVELIATQ